jgi:hypothetical protein
MSKDRLGHGQPGACGLAVDHLVHGGEEGDDLAVLDLDALRTPGGAGRVHDVGEVARPSLLELHRDGRSGRRGREDRAPARREARSVGAARDQRAQAGIGGDVPLPLGGVGRVERHVRRSDRQHGEGRHDDVGAAGHGHADAVARAGHRPRERGGEGARPRRGPPTR